eukprot:gene11162-23327_t
MFNSRRLFSNRYIQNGTLALTAIASLQNSDLLSSNTVLCDAKMAHKVSVSTYDANSPSEDRYCIQSASNWNAYCVLDGHGGWQVSEFAKTNLFNILLPSIEKIKPNNEQEINSQILSAFASVEKKYIELIRPAYKLGHGSVASVGACALVALRNNNDLYIANCGDCRAVLAHTSTSTSTKDGKKEYVTSRITRDHNARIPYEAALLRKLHPGEKDVVVCKSETACYVKGRLQLTCALGDLYLKYPEFNAPSDSHRSLGRHIPSPYTPPYVRSIPDIFHIKLNPEHKFLILASDGVWDFLTDEEAVSIVANCTHPDTAAEELVCVVLDRAAKDCGMSVDELKALPRGRHRRGRHDDTTAIVIQL